MEKWLILVRAAGDFLAFTASVLTVVAVIQHRRP
jgi:hypothetical protein